ncbi:MAG: ATPase domain-containing protein [Thermoplasmatota archaeon]
MAADSTSRQELLKNMSDIEQITKMLGKLKVDLKKKEALLVKMEEALGQSEERLEKKVSEINEKTKRLDEIEGKLLKRQEELEIQEKEVQTNAILEFLSFQAREMEIQERANNAPDPSEVEDLRERIKEMNDQIKAKEIEIEDLRNAPGKIAVPEAQPLEQDGQMEELDGLKKQLEEMKKNLDEKEIQLLRKEEDLRSKEHKMSQGISDEDRKVIEALSERENQLLKLEEQIKNKQKEIAKFMEGLERKDNRIKELENELHLKQEMIRLHEDEGAAIADTKDVKEVKEVLESEYQAKLNMIEGNYKNLMDSMKSKFDQLKVRNEELEMMGDQLSAEKLRVTLLEREMKERMNEISFAEERLARRQELMLKERKQIDEQLKKAKDTETGGQIAELNEELANRQKQLRDIEQKLREREEYLRKREQELQQLRSSLVDEEMKMEIMESKDDLNRVRTGVRRFDDLCYGGFQHNSNFILFGPAYSGRRTFTNLFIAEGLKKGIPTIYVVTQHTPTEVKDSLRTIIPKVDAYEEKGLIKYIDLYSKSMGITDEYPNTIYVEKPTDLDAIENAIGEFQAEFKDKHPYHKIVFFSVSTLLTYIEPLNIFRFFQVLNAKNKRNNAVSVYVVDTGMHKASDIQTLKHTMTGFIEFKLDDLKYYLRVEGGGDVMSRAWIEYTFTDKTFDLRGSFSLDHIR